jgi:hypothetical protein
VKKEMYIDIFCRFRNAVGRKRLKKWRTVSWFLPHDNAPERQMVLVKDFLAKSNVTTLEHPLYTPDLAPDDFYLFPQSAGSVLL